MITREVAEKIEKMIEKECGRESLDALCNQYNISLEDYYEFLGYAFNYIDKNNKKLYWIYTNNFIPYLCPKCNTENSYKSKYCPECGERLW